MGNHPELCIIISLRKKLSYRPILDNINVDTNTSTIRRYYGMRILDYFQTWCCLFVLVKYTLKLNSKLSAVITFFSRPMAMSVYRVLSCASSNINTLRRNSTIKKTLE